MSNLKIVICNPVTGKTKKEYDNEIKEIVDKLFDYYGDDNIQYIENSIYEDINNSLQSLSHNIYLMDKVDTLCMCKGWESDVNCKLEHIIGSVYNKNIIYIDEITGL